MICDNKEGAPRARDDSVGQVLVMFTQYCLRAMSNLSECVLYLNEIQDTLGQSCVSCVQCSDVNKCVHAIEAIMPLLSTR